MIDTKLTTNLFKSTQTPPEFILTYYSFLYFLCLYVAMMFFGSALSLYFHLLQRILKNTF